MSRQQQRVSMAMVAARAGVSGQTVSRVVNESPRVDPATRARVESAMAELGYRPHRAARALRTGRSRTIGLVATTLATIGNSRMLQAVAEAAASRGYALTVITLGADTDIAGAFERLRDEGVDGAIVLNEATALVDAHADTAGVRLLVVDSPPDDRFSVVAVDHAEGAAAVVRHLLSLGHRTVHHLAGPTDSYAATERERGWREALDAAGVAAPSPLRGDWTAASGAVLAARLPASATALFAANDQMALGALQALSRTGKPVPEAVSVVGFDDIVDAAHYQPPLTTVRQDFGALGDLAIRTLVDQIEHDAAPADQRLPATLVIRESTAAPPAAKPAR